MTLASAKRIVIKVGSALVTNGGSGLDQTAIAQWAREIAALVRSKREVVLVSSGAIAEGMQRLGWSQRPHAMNELQAAAAVGQMGLIQVYESCFREHGLHTAQILLTHADLADRQRYLNARSTLLTLLSLGVIPVINENDTVVTDEIRFGDNDRLAALVAVLVKADLLVLFSDIEALYDRPPSEAGAQAIDWIEPLDDLSGIKMGESASGVGTGGAVTKVGAARTATDAGISVLLTSINNAELALSGQRLGTWFQAKEQN